VKRFTQTVRPEPVEGLSSSKLSEGLRQAQPERENWFNGNPRQHPDLMV
jgi:hypothetical protein